MPKLRQKVFISFSDLFSWVVVVVVLFSAMVTIFNPGVKAATGGQMTLYLHKENSDANQTYNAMTFTPPEPSSFTTSTLTSTTPANANPATSFCESSGNTSDNLNDIGASTAATSSSGRCFATFISAPLGVTAATQIQFQTTDGSSISGQFYFSESANQVNEAPVIDIYRWSGTGTTVSASDLIVALSCPSEPGTSVTSCSATGSPANNVTVNTATDRLIAIVYANYASRSGSNIQTYFDSTANPASITLKYTAYGSSYANRPALTGTMDDDFTTDSATTACTTGGVTYNTKWTCLQGTATGTTGNFNAGGTSGTINGDSSGWVWVQNRITATGVTPCDFNHNSGGSCGTPSNTFMYQSMPTAYGDGSITTILNSSAFYDVNSTPLTSGNPFSHAGLVLWASNSDYLELQVYANAATNDTGTNTVNVALNNSGTLGTATSLNSTTTAGKYNNIWLRLTNTGGSWQAQYSTDGSSFTNVGTAVSHTTGFTRTGFDAYSAVTPGATTANETSYAGAFEWFSYALAGPTFNQTGYRFFDNADAVDPTATFNGGTTARNTPITLTSSGQQFRLRQLIKTNGSVATSGQSFKEQYADLSTYGSCSAIPSGNWADLSYANTNAANFAGIGANDSSNGGTVAWAGPGNISATDSSYATATFSSGGGTTNYITAENFGFSIPSTATINGITVTVRKSTNATNQDSAARLIKAAAIQTTDRSNVGNWNTVDTDSGYGNSSDLWGTTWTPSDINASNFGFALASVSQTTGQLRIDSIKITVYYTTTGNIAYYDNPTPNSGNAINSTGNDPTDTGQTVSYQTYQESNPFTNGVSAYGYTIDGLWDFSLVDNSATAGTTYCFRTAISDGTALNTYTNYPMVTIFSSGGPPTPTTDQLLRGGQWFYNGSKQPYYWAK